MCVSLEDLGDLLDLISKCCNLKRSTLSSCQHDCTLLGGCVPQVFDLDQLQHDIAKKYIAGKINGVCKALEQSTPHFTPKTNLHHKHYLSFL